MRPYTVTVTQTYEVDAESAAEAEMFIENNLSLLEPDTCDIAAEIPPAQDRREAA